MQPHPTLRDPVDVYLFSTEPYVLFSFLQASFKVLCLEDIASRSEYEVRIGPHIMTVLFEVESH